MGGRLATTFPRSRSGTPFRLARADLASASPSIGRNQSRLSLDVLRA